MAEREAPEDAGRPDLVGLAPEKIRLRHLRYFPQMTGWFDPRLLSKLLLRVVISDMFGQYADRRLIEAALDPVTDDDVRKRSDLSHIIKPDEDGAMWIDFVADLGDGFDATYAIAYLLAQPHLNVEGCESALPRGQLLVMGGDEVYPTALRADYTKKLRKPYGLAFPDNYTKGSAHPPVFLLPGNHDWYDGLVNFLALFCRQKPTSIGNWRTRQQRSYFAVQLMPNWWLWGIDIALISDMDQPQADYFVAAARCIPQDANIIICTAEPGWYKADQKSGAFRTLSYVSWIAENAKKNLRMPLILSGDTHHYARYSGGGAQYITSGGGGAFLHGTHDLKDEIEGEWLYRANAKFSLKTTADETHAPCDTPACYPTKAESLKLLSGNWCFAWLNPQFSIFLGALYGVFAFALTVRSHWDVGLLVFAALFGGFWAYTGYQEKKFMGRVLVLSLVHALAHFIAIYALYRLAEFAGASLHPLTGWHWLPWLIFVEILGVLSGVVAGTIFGLNLLITCRWFGLNHNDAFSAMKLDSYRHFLRIRIQGETVKVFPVSIDRVPRRDEWRENPLRFDDPTKPKVSAFIPSYDMKPHLIEGPVVIKARDAPTTGEVKQPSGMPPAR